MHGEPVDAALMATNQEPERLRIALAGGGNELSVGTLRQVLARGGNQ